MAQADGSPRIAGQLLGYLLVQGGARSLQQIADDLKVSKASASTNARLLEGHGMLRRVTVAGSRQDSWELLPDPYDRVLGTLADRFRNNARVIEDVSSQFPEGREDARERVCSFADFYRKSADFLDEWNSYMSKADPVPQKEDQE